MNVTITPSPLRGTVTPPPSKSQVHRLIIAASLAEGESRISHVAFSQDILATLRCMRALGAQITEGENRLTVRGISRDLPPSGSPDLPVLDCGESGSTLRFLIPVALALRGGGIFVCRGRLAGRPLEPYFQLFRERGISFGWSGNALTVRGCLTPGEYRLAGNVSSQFLTGLMFALPLLDGPSAVRSVTPLESSDYLVLTMDVLRDSGVVIARPEEDPGCFQAVPSRYLPGDRTAEADWSQAGFWYAAGLLGNDVAVSGMNPDSAQGDRCVVSCCDRLRVSGPAELDMSGCPDLLPPLAACAALRGDGAVTRLTGAARLRMKESDRLSAVTSVLGAMGAEVREFSDSLTISGKDFLIGGAVTECFHDHRIAMMAAVAATRCRNSVTLLGAECVEKSYPDFWEEYGRLGGIIVREEADPAGQ